MIGEKNFDERQLIVRGKVGFQTTLLCLILILVTALFADEIIKYVDMSDYLISMAQMIITYLSINLMIHDAYVGLYENGNVKIFMITLICLFFLMLGLLMFHFLIGDNIISKDYLISYSSILFSGSVSLTFFMKQRMEKN